MSARNAQGAVLEFERLERLVNGDENMPRWYLESRHTIFDHNRINPQLMNQAEGYLWKRLQLETKLHSDVPGIPIPGTAEAEGLEIFASETRNWFDRFADVGYIPDTLTLEKLLFARNPEQTTIEPDVPCLT